MAAAHPREGAEAFMAAGVGGRGSPCHWIKNQGEQAGSRRVIPCLPLLSSFPLDPHIPKAGEPCNNTTSWGAMFNYQEECALKSVWHYCLWAAVLPYQRQTAARVFWVKQKGKSKPDSIVMHHEIWHACRKLIKKLNMKLSAPIFVSVKLQASVERNGFHCAIFIHMCHTLFLFVPTPHHLPHVPLLTTSSCFSFLPRLMLPSAFLHVFPHPLHFLTSLTICCPIS